MPTPAGARTVGLAPHLRLLLYERLGILGIDVDEGLANEDPAKENVVFVCVQRHAGDAMRTEDALDGPRVALREHDALLRVFQVLLALLCAKIGGARHGRADVHRVAKTQVGDGWASRRSTHRLQLQLLPDFVLACVQSPELVDHVLVDAAHLQKHARASAWAP